MFADSVQVNVCAHTCVCMHVYVCAHRCMHRDRRNKLFPSCWRRAHAHGEDGWQGMRVPVPLTPSLPQLHRHSWGAEGAHGSGARTIIRTVGTRGPHTCLPSCISSSESGRVENKATITHNEIRGTSRHKVIQSPNTHQTKSLACPCSGQNTSRGQWWGQPLASSQDSSFS